MAEVSFESLRKEALKDFDLEPFVLKMPGKQKNIVIENVPTGLFLTTFSMDNVDPNIGRAWRFLEAVCPKKDWKRLSDELWGQPLPVVMGIVTAITEHFNLTFTSEVPKDSEEPDES